MSKEKVNSVITALINGKPFSVPRFFFVDERYTIADIALFAHTQHLLMKVV